MALENFGPTAQVVLEYGVNVDEKLPDHSMLFKMIKPVDDDGGSGKSVCSFVSPIGNELVKKETKSHDSGHCP